MELYCVGVNHRETPLELREKLALKEGEQRRLLDRLREEEPVVQEAVILGTCNRLEFYLVTSTGWAKPKDLLRRLMQWVKGREDPAVWETVDPVIYAFQGKECIHHLFRVAGSLDSQIVGETEIVGQVKQAYQRAQAAKTAGKILSRTFQKAFHASKQVRTRSGIGRCSTSVGSVAVDLAAQIFDADWHRRTVLIIGAGKIGETTMRHLVKKGAQSILVANRSFDRACELASEYQAEAIPLKELPRGLARADVIISSTGAEHYLIDKAALVPALAKNRNGAFLFIDLAVPRDIDPDIQELPGVYLYNLDQLSRIAKENLNRREAEAEACESLVADHARSFGGWLERATTDRVIRSAPRPSICRALLAGSQYAYS